MGTFDESRFPRPSNIKFIKLWEYVPRATTSDRRFCIIILLTLIAAMIITSAVGSENGASDMARAFPQDLIAAKK